jgi:PAS domain S-box-containing protein
MRHIAKDFRQHTQKTSLSQRLILGLVLVVAAVIVFSGVPANIAMWLQLERQVWMRVQDAQAATQALYDAEITRLKKLGGLFAGRPTLYRLAEQGDTAALEPYLNALQEESGNLDVVQVITPAFRAGDQLAGLPDPEIFLAGNEPYFADFVSLGQPAQLYIVAVSLIQPSGEDNPLEGYVLLARQIKSDYMLALEQETGLAQSLIVAKTRVATSLPGAPEWALDTDSALQVENTRQPRFTQGSIQSETYYFGLMPLSDSQGNVVALSEVALAGGAIRRDMLGTTVISAGISLLVMLVGLLLVVRQARTITHPLRQLSQAAERLSQGNLDIPTPVDSGIPEIDQLAQHFDLARRQLRQTLAVTQREMKHAERLLSSVRQGVVALDEEGRITFFNPDAEEILGYRAENVLHHHYSHIFPPAPDDTMGMKEILGKLAGDISPQRVNILDARGRPLLLAVHTSLLEGDLPDGSAPERVLVIRDVTEEEAVGRLRYNFLANVAHEFRTPLSGIAATTELLVEASYSLTQDELVRLIETIQLSTLHLQTLVNNLLESTTIEAGCFQVHRRPISFLEVAQDAVGMMGPLLNRRDQELVITSPQDMPTLWADNNRLTQVLVNLLSNASKFSPMGGKIELVIAQDPHWLTVTILDCGPGLPAGLFADLFKRFVTDNQPHETQYGIGLGLSVVKSIVELHGGQVGAENRPDGGAKVWFTIPVQPPEEI